MFLHNIQTVLDKKNILKNWRQIKLNVFSTDLVEKNWCWELPVVNNGNSRRKVRLVFSKLETNWNNEFKFYISLIYKKQSVFRKYDIGKKHKNTVNMLIILLNHSYASYHVFFLYSILWQKTSFSPALFT